MCNSLSISNRAKTNSANAPSNAIASFSWKTTLRHYAEDFQALPAELRQRYAPTQAKLFAQQGKSAEQRSKTRQQVAEDLRDLIDRFADHAGLHDRPSYQALVTVFQQQCEIVDDKVCVKAKTTGRCVQNPSDPDATYDGHKGPGYQAQLVETCSPTNDVQLIVTALPQTAVESDAEAFVPVLEALAAKEMLPDTMLMDTAYGSDDNVQAAAAQGVDVVSPVAGPKSDTSATPVPEPATTESATAPMEKLTIDDFATDERTGRVDACPSGRIPLKVVRDAETGTTTIEMSPADCQNCPFRQACPIDEKPDGQFRTSYTDKQKRLAGRRQEQRTPVFRERYAARAGIESTNSGLKRRLGLGRLRVRGQRAVFHAIYLKVAGWNLLRAAASGRLRQKVAAYLAQLGLALRWTAWTKPVLAWFGGWRLINQANSLPFHLRV